MFRNTLYRLIYLYKSIILHVRSRVYSFVLNCPTNVKFGKIGLIEGKECIHIGNNCVFNDGIFLTAWPGRSENQPKLIIRNNCCFGAYNHISCINRIEIGDNLLTGKWVTIVDNDHGDTRLETLKIPPKERSLYSKGIVEIGDNVWIGDKVTILSGVKIGNCSIIAANSVVTKDIPPFSVVGGNPAKILKKY